MALTAKEVILVQYDLALHSLFKSNMATQGNMLMARLSAAGAGFARFGDQARRLWREGGRLYPCRERAVVCAGTRSWP
jgi:hypothetical protein